MAERPWVTPAEVRDYSDQANVNSRTDAKLAVDISRAEWYVVSYTRNRFDDNEKYPVVPEPVKTAVILLAESYASGAVTLAKDGGGGNYKSESFDDYSYTAADIADKIGNLNLGSLLDAFVITEVKGAVTMRMRKL